MIQIAQYANNYWMRINKVDDFRQFNTLLTPKGESYVSVIDYFSKKFNIDIVYAIVRKDKYDNYDIISLFTKNDNCYIKDIIKIDENISIGVEEDYDGDAGCPVTYLSINIPISDIKEL